MRISALAVLLSAFLISFSPAQTQAQNTENLVKIRLLPEAGMIAPGQEIWVGIEQSITPEWHTYWRNPGDSGAAPRATWRLPTGFSISPINWPVPEKLSYGPLLNYGYKDHVILLQKLRAPETLPQGPIELSADIEVLVCKEECIPEFGTYTLALNGPEGTAEDNRIYLQDAAAKLPGESGVSVFYSDENGRLAIAFMDQSLREADIGSFEILPIDWGILDNPAAPETTLTAEGITIRQKRGVRALNAIEKLEGLLKYTQKGAPRAITFTAMPQAAAPAPTPSAPTTNNQPGFIQALILALLGGMVLNLMPCVFPVLSLKALSLVKIAEKHPNLARLHGLSYTAGIILSFLTVAGILLALKAAGSQIGWGFQLQNPIVVTLLAYLLFIIGLNLSGLFEISGNFGNFGSRLVQGEGLSASFFAGVLATLVATPCTAPFMAAAVGYALVSPAIVSLTVFAALGLGLALPYLALSFIPAARAGLPKPGAWMEIFRQLLAFPMFASAAWLVWVLSMQTSPGGFLCVLFGMIMIAFAFWLWQHQPKSPRWKTVLQILTALSFVAALALIPAGMMDKKSKTAAATHEFGETYTPQTLETALKDNTPVFVEMTAAWCITCKVNHAVALDTSATRDLFAEKSVRYLIGDWTNQDPEITAYLNSFGRNGVPLYVYYATPDENGQRPEPVLLPQILTPGIVANTIERN